MRMCLTTNWFVNISPVICSTNPRLHPQAGYNESILGTGFWFLGEWVHSPVDIRKDEAIASTT